MMNITRRLPQSNITRRRAMNMAIDKYNNVDIAHSALTPATAARLINDSTAFNNAMSNINTAEERKATANANTTVSRVLLRKNVSAYFNGINNAISIGTIPGSARAFYGLEVSNKRLPVTNTDSKLLQWADQIISGDAKRVANGGIDMANPSIDEFAAIYDAAKPLFITLSNAKSNVTNAHVLLNKQVPEVDKIILKTWNEIETSFSELPAPKKRSYCREWGVLYISVGTYSIISGKYTDSETGDGLMIVKVHLSGVAKGTLTDAQGNFTLHTTLYGDMELIATLKNYNENSYSFQKDDGENIEVNEKMTPQ